MLSPPPTTKHHRTIPIGVGAYRDDSGAPWVLPSVRAAEGAAAAALLRGGVDGSASPTRREADAAALPHDNPKGNLLFLGGNVTVARVADSPDHEPRFLATASLNGCLLRREASSKRAAEAAAAAALLERLDEG